MYLSVAWVAVCLFLAHLLRLGCVVTISMLDAFVDGVFSWSVYWCHDSCMTCVCVAVSLGSSRSSWFAGIVSVALRVDNAMSTLLGGCGLLALCMLADIASAFSMKMRVCPSVAVRLSSSDVQVF
jgi:hypothetical protein